MSLPFLQLLDNATAAGAALLSPAFKAPHARFVHSNEQPDGGFCGRRGTSEIYYTDFALRALMLLEAAPDLAPSARWLPTARFDLDSPADRFNALNIRRMLLHRGIDACLQTEPIIDAIALHLRKACPPVSPVKLFLDALSLEALNCGQDLLRPLAPLVQQRRCTDGGYADDGILCGQTNVTAAAIGFLLIAGAADLIEAEAAASFLIGMQAPDGGLRAYAAAPAGDLLSTFTGIVALHALGALGRLDLSSAARFLKSLQSSQGGFRGWLGDLECDVEYTFYGVACTALLRLHASASTRENTQ